MRCGASALLAFALVSAAAPPGPDEKKALKKYTIDLDKAPEDRFTEVVLDHKEYIQGIVTVLRALMKGDAVQRVIAAAKVPDEYRREMQAVADLVNVTYEDSLMANYYYELSSLPSVAAALPEEWRGVATRSCTGIVAQNANGTVMHGRNQDYPPPFSPLQFDGTFVKGGKVVFEATTFAGTVGVGGTCMVPGAFSAEINARSTNSPSVDDAVKYAAEGAWAFPLLLREGCTRGGSFVDVVQFLSDTPQINPGYYTVAGAAPGEGAIITRNSTVEGTDVLMLDAGYPTDAPWFLVQTNYDHWKGTGLDRRRESAIKLVSAIGRDAVDLASLWGVLSDTGNSTHVWPGVYNVATIHTELIVPQTGEYHTYLRHNII